VHEKLYEIGSESDALPENAAPWWLKVRERLRRKGSGGIGKFRNVDLGCFDLGCLFFGSFGFE